MMRSDDENKKILKEVNIKIRQYKTKIKGLKINYVAQIKKLPSPLKLYYLN